MVDPHDGTPSLGDPDGLARAALLRRRICEAWEDIEQLIAERQGLEEVLQNLRLQQESLADRLAVLETESRDTAERIDHNQRRLHATEAEIQLMNEQNEGLSGERTFIGRQARKLSRTAAVLQGELDKRRRQVTAMQASFETITTQVLKMDYKLQHPGDNSYRHESETEHEES